MEKTLRLMRRCQKNVHLRKIWMTMKLTMVLFFLAVSQMMASEAYSQTTKMTLQLKDATVKEVLNRIEEKSEFFFLYNSKLVDVDRKVSVDVNDQKISEILNDIFSKTDVVFTVVDRQIVLTNKADQTSLELLGSQQSGKKVAGKVTDSSGASLPGVSVIVKGTTTGIVTDINGNYSLPNVPENAVLQFSFVGMLTQEVSSKNKTTIDVALADASIGIEEIVAVGYGVQKKKLVTGATVQVKGEELTKLNTVSPMAALQSQSSGVNITKVSGEPGAGFKVNIRGIGTIGNSQPLYVVDGAPRGDINYLAPSDIESIDILKDAASSAIYGSRAANGVVLVTTKQGKAGKMSIAYDGYYGVQNMYKRLPLLDGKEYLMIMNEANMNSNLGPITPAQWNSYLAPGDYNRIQNGSWTGTNWLKQMENKNAPIQSHALNMNGGNEFSKYSIGFSYTSQEGILGAPVQSNYDRYSLRINSDHVILRKSFDVIKIGENVSMSYNQNHGIATGNMWWNDVANAVKALPVLPMYAADKTDPAYPYHYAIPWNTNYSNPNAAMALRGSNLNKGLNLNVNAYIEIQPIKGLKYRSSFTMNPSASSYRGWTPKSALGPVAIATTTGTSQSMSFGMGGYIFENTLNYDFKVQEAHSINVLVGTTAERWGLGDNLSTSNSGNVFNDFDHAYISNANVPATATISGSPWGKGGLLSYFGRINYDYKEKYMLSLIMRADGSSNFASGHRWGKFPSVSGGWVVSNESFMENTKSFIDFLKIRGSWGQNGNQSIPGFQYLSLISYSDGNNPANYYFGTSKTALTQGAYPSNIPTPDLKWETSEQLDLGVDARFAKSKLNVAFDYYIKTTKDWLVAAPVLASWGVINAPYINGGEIQNKGVELSLGWKDNIGEFKYSVSGNVSYNKNEVTRIDNSQGIINATNVKLWGNGTYVARAQVGYPLGYFYGYNTAGIFQNDAEVANYKNKDGKVIMPTAQPGDVKFVDRNGDGIIDDNDKTNLGSGNPSTIYSLNLSFEYKGFDLGVATYGVGGNKIARMFHDAGGPQDNYTTEILGRWHGEGTSNKIPRVLNGASINQQYTSDLQIENGAYFKISNVTLGYDFKKILKTIPLSQLRFYCSVQNLYTFTKYSGMDPEIGTSTDDSNAGWVHGIDLGFYPNPRTILFGASIKF